MNGRKVVIIGYGSIGQALTPLLFKHFPDLKAEDVQIITADNRGSEVAAEYGIRMYVEPLTVHNMYRILGHHAGYGSLVINVSVDVSSHDVIAYCRERNCLYIDTCVEPWAGGYSGRITNAKLRDEALGLWRHGAPTALIAHGANPGLVSHFIKRALENLMREKFPDSPLSLGYDYRSMARQLGVRAIQIAERDTQDDGIPLEQGEFRNTWSVDGLLSEARQYAELGWGSHEKSFPISGQWAEWTMNSIFLAQSSAEVKVKSWVPSVGEQEAYLITHHEAVSTSEWLHCWGYRPTVYYAYRPCEKTCMSLENWKASGFAEPTKKTIMSETVQGGFDELGVLLIMEGESYWYGSTLTNDEAKSLAPHNNATSLQVVSTMIGAIEWMLDNPTMGVVEAEEVDHNRVLKVALPYLGTVQGYKTDWQPGVNSTLQFEDFLINK